MRNCKNVKSNWIVSKNLREHLQLWLAAFHAASKGGYKNNSPFCYRLCLNSRSVYLMKFTALFIPSSFSQGGQGVLSQIFFTKIKDTAKHSRKSCNCLAQKLSVTILITFCTQKIPHIVIISKTTKNLGHFIADEALIEQHATYNTSKKSSFSELSAMRCPFYLKLIQKKKQ